MNLGGARVVITGASRGIGEALARACAARGARVVLVARSHEQLAKLAADLGGEALPADLSVATSIEPLVRKIEADGPIDVLVNNAGLDLTGALTELPADKIAQLLDVNLLAPILLCRAAMPGMIARRHGHIVNVSSLASTNAIPGLVPYSASKAGLSHFTAGLRAELKGTGVTTTLVEIGTVRTEMLDSVESHPPTQRALDRLARLQLSVDIELEPLIDEMVDAIEHDRRHVRLPKRDVLFPMMAEAPRRITEWLLAGVK
jgi:short-subunit dehydrogenase